MSETMAEAEHFILFYLAGTSYGIPSRLVQQVEMVKQITPVPHAPAFIDGLILIREQVVPVINLKVRFGFEKTDYNLSTRLIVIQSGKRVAGLLVDSAREFMKISAEIIQPPPQAVAGLSGKYLKGIAMMGSRMIFILHTDAILALPNAEDAVGS